MPCSRFAGLWVLPETGCWPWQSTTPSPSPVWRRNSATTTNPPPSLPRWARDSPRADAPRSRQRRLSRWSWPALRCGWCELSPGGGLAWSGDPTRAAITGGAGQRAAGRCSTLVTRIAEEADGWREWSWMAASGTPPIWWWWRPGNQLPAPSPLAVPPPNPVRGSG